MKVGLYENEYYHVYNRGVDKRVVFENSSDAKRFLDLVEINTGSVSLGGFKYKEQPAGRKNRDESEPLVEVLAYALMGNHYHILLRQLSPDGVAKFMHKLGTAYTMYFNNKNERSGSLFGGRYKYSHIDSNEHLQYVAAYVLYNDLVHGTDVKKQNVVSSRQEHTGEIRRHITPAVSTFLPMFKSEKQFETYAVPTVNEIAERRVFERQLKELLVD